MRLTIVFALLAAPALLSAQTSATVSPGMTHVQVVAALGEPVNSRTAKEYTYLFYQNSCGKECGMNDLVILLRDSVVDAIFRSPNRHYTGTSSSPEETTPAVARRRGEPAVAAKPLTVKPAATATKPAATVVAKPTVPAVTRPAPTTAAKPAPKTDTASAKTEPKPAVVVAPAVAPTEVKGTKTSVVVKGTNREVVVPGTNVDVVTPATERMTPPAANDTRPSIPLSQPIRDDSTTPPAPKPPTS
jgi:hypothetical protein